jgi:hypothetical protein
MLKSLQMISVNQIAAERKLTDMWKSLNDSQCSHRAEQKSEIEDENSTRNINRRLNRGNKKVPKFYSAKKTIKSYCKTLPI